MELHKFRRGGDKTHFDLVGSIYPSTGMSLASVLEIVRREYPVRGPLMHCDTILSLSNKCRVEMNIQLNNFHTKANVELVMSGAKGESDMKIWPGIILQSTVTDRKHLRNALRYRVIDVTKEVCNITRINDEGDVVGEQFTMPTQDIGQSLRLTYAITYDSSQSRTLYGKVRLVQTNHKHMTLRRLIVGLGRAPSGSQLEVE